MTAHPVYDTVKGAAVGTYLQVRTAAAPAYLGVGVLQRSRPNARARRGIRLNFADSDHQQQVIAGSCRPPIAHTHAMPVPVRPIGRTGTEVNAVTTSRKSKPRSQSQKTAVPDNRSQRLNIVLDARAKRTLQRLASCYGVTQRVVLHRLLASAEQSVLNQLLALPNGQDQYYDQQLPAVLDFVTQ